METRSGGRDVTRVGGRLSLVIRVMFLAGGLVVVFFGLWFMRRDALKYLDWSPETFQRFWPNRVLLALHIVGAGVALLVGPIQFIPALRRAVPKLHRVIGWTYVIAVLVSTPFAIRLATYSTCSLCVAPFVAWGSVTMLVTAAALITALRGSYRAHQDFMIRSCVLMYGFVLVRLDGHLIGTPLELPLASGASRNPMLIWLAWTVPLLLVEVRVSWIPAVRRAFRPRRSGGMHSSPT